MKKAVLSIACIFSFVFTNPSPGRVPSVKSTTFEADNIEESEKKIFGSTEILNAKIRKLYAEIDAEKEGLAYAAFRYAMIGYFSLQNSNKIDRDKALLSIIDFTKSSREERFFTVDLKAKKIIFSELVSHGKNSGGDMATAFSNKPESYQSSLGFYITGNHYTGSKGYSMRLHGTEKGYNDKMFDRAIVMHTADYVSSEFADKMGRLGRSYGCPVLRKEISKKVIDTIKGGTAIFAYYADSNYLNSSAFLKTDKLISAL